MQGGDAVPPRRVTSKDVAAAAGVSRTAVSLVLNHRADGMIEPGKQERIRAVAAELGYVPNAAAVNLQRRSTATIGLVTDEIASRPFAGPLIDGATSAAMAAGYMLLTIDTSFHDDRIGGAIDTLRGRDVDALVYAAASVHGVTLPEQPGGLTTVLANAFDPTGRVAGFVPDDRGGERAAVELAIEAGHRRIAFITGDADAPATRARIAGFREAMDAAGLPVDDRNLLPASYSMRAHHEVATRLLTAPDRPTVVLCGNDRGAAGTLLAAASLGLRVPDDLSVIGFDDEHSFADDVPPGLTTVALPHREMGVAAVEHLLALLAGGPDAVAGGTRELACVPVVRGSLGPPPASVRDARA